MAGAMIVLHHLLSVIASAGIAGYGLRKKSLSRSGAAAAFVVGTGHFSSGLRFGITLIVFFLSASRLTKVKSSFKAKVEEDFKESGQRNVWQVLANGSGGLLFSLLAARWQASNPQLVDIALLGFLGHYACCCSDTFSSELGILSYQSPILITTGKAVPRGTNGGVSIFGTAAGAAGGLFMGIVFALTARWDATRHGSNLAISLIPLGLVLGLIGTFIDSLLGATCQYTGYSTQLGRVVGKAGPGVQHISGQALLSNDQVNLVSAALTSAVGVIIALAIK